VHSNRDHGQEDPSLPTQTNGKIERFHRILLEEWAYISDWASEHQRAEAFTGFVHHHRPTGSLGWATPIDTIRDNLPATHN
jgi:transposase InsO family protein